MVPKFFHQHMYDVVEIINHKQINNIRYIIDEEAKSMRKKPIFDAKILVFSYKKIIIICGDMAHDTMTSQRKMSYCSQDHTFRWNNFQM